MWNDIPLNLQVIKGHADFVGKIVDFHHVSLVRTSSQKTHLLLSQGTVWRQSVLMI